MTANKNTSLGVISSPPLAHHETLTFGELFKTLCKSNGWGQDPVSEYIGISSDGIKSWTRAIEPSVPHQKNLKILYKLIEDRSKNGVHEEWISALQKAVMRHSIRPRTKGAALDLRDSICRRILCDSYLTHLPALFEADQTLPIATSYVELQLSPALDIQPNAQQLDMNLTLRQRINRKIDSRYRVRRSPEALLDTATSKTTLILGAPGSGKSSLLKSINVDIAQGKWKYYQIPLFVEIGSYWVSKKHGAAEDMVSYALKQLLPPGSAIEEIKKQLFSNKSESPILLLDGLDEIASDGDAVKYIYAEIRSMGRSLPWIATSRPAGFMASLGAVQRCELLGLDDDSIEILIDNWCDSITSTTIDADHFKVDIMMGAGTRDMARNPFLLTALCFLKSIKPGKQLPRSRIAIYEELLQGIVDQAQMNGNTHVLSKPSLASLQEFSHSLYNHSEGSIHIFNRDIWQQFTESHPRAEYSYFDENIYPSRILSTYKGGKNEFHFIHLSIQEHLVAREIFKNGSLEEALKQRFNPSWRNVFRFYGALLFHNGDIETFRKLVNFLYEERDTHSLSLVTLSSIFTDAGINSVEDIRDWIEENLHEELYTGFESGFDSISEEMLGALAELDPAWLEQTTQITLEEAIDFLEKNTPIEDDEYPGSGFIMKGRSSDSPYECLARARTPTAIQTIRETFWGESQSRALMAAYAYAAIAPPSDRKKIFEKGMDLSTSESMLYRIFAFSKAIHRAEFAPFLADLADFYSENGGKFYQEVIDLLADIGGPDAEKVFTKLSVKEAQRLPSLTGLEEKQRRTILEPLFILIKAIARMGDDGAIRILDKIAYMPETAGLEMPLSIFRIQASPTDEESIINALTDPASFDETVSAISAAASYDRHPSDNIISMIREAIDADSMPDITDLALLESARVEFGHKPMLCDQLLSIALQLYDKIQKESNRNNLETLNMHIQMIFDALARAKWKPASALVTRILDHASINEDLIGSTLSLAGYIYATTSDTDILRKMKPFIFDDNSTHAQTAAFAIGRIDLEALYRLQSADMVTSALEELAAENDWRIFENFWVDQNGTVTQWLNPPKKILYVYDDEAPELAYRMAHELSRYGFCLEEDDPEACVASIILNDQEGYAADMAEQARRIYRYTGDANPLFELLNESSEETAITKARDIGIELNSRYHTLHPPVYPS